MIKTSKSNPLRIDSVRFLKSKIGMTFCPGKKQSNAMSGGNWDRDLDADLLAIKDFGATALLCLVEDHELIELHVPNLAEIASEYVKFYRMPIIDGNVPDLAAEESWLDIGNDLRQRLMNGENIVIHCKGGLGRTGTIAARLLVELGEEPLNAIKRVRDARPGAIENEKQERYVINFARS